MASADSPKRPWLLALVLATVSVAVIVALLSSDPSGTGAENVGEPASQEAPVAAATAEPAEADPPAGDATATPAPARSCKATQSNPGGDNNYIPDAPERDSLGEGFEVTGLVRSARDCRPLPGVRIQVWLATETGGEQDNRASVETDEDGRYRIETAPTIAQFGEPNIHVAYDDGEYRDVFIRRVVDLDDVRARVDLTLARGG